MTWLVDDKDRAKKGKLKAMMDDSHDGTVAHRLLIRSPEKAEAKHWVTEQSAERARREMEGKEVEYQGRLEEARKREARMRKMAQASNMKRFVGSPINLMLRSSIILRHFQKHGPQPPNNPPQMDDDVFLPESDDNPNQKEGDVYMSPALRALMAKSVIIRQF